MVRQGLCSLLDAYEDIHVVGEASNGKEAIELASRLKPDVILLDVTMPDIDGIEVTKRIKSDHPHVLIIGMSVHSARTGGKSDVQRRRVSIHPQRGRCR